MVDFLFIFKVLERLAKDKSIFLRRIIYEEKKVWKETYFFLSVVASFNFS